MKKLISTLTISILFITGCQLTEIEYNDQIASSINKSSEKIESTILQYDESVPDTVTELSEIETEEMIISLNAAKTALESAKTLTFLESTNLEQSTAVKAELDNYIALAETYLGKYEEMIEYYRQDIYLEDLTLVSQYDTEIYESCNAFIESNNTLVEILESYT